MKSGIISLTRIISLWATQWLEYNSSHSEKMKTNFISISAIATWVSIASHAVTYTDKYTGPVMSSEDHLVVTFTTAAKLAANKSYVTGGTTVAMSITIN